MRRHLVSRKPSPTLKLVRYTSSLQEHLRRYQVDEWQGLITILGGQIKAFTYNGDMPANARRAVRARETLWSATRICCTPASCPQEVDEAVREPVLVILAASLAILSVLLRLFLSLVVPDAYQILLRNI